MHILINTNISSFQQLGTIIITADLINWNFSMIMFPTRIWKIQWLYLVIATGLSDSALEKGEIEKFLSTFGHASLNKKWHSGVLKALKPSKQCLMALNLMQLKLLPKRKQSAWKCQIV